MRTKELLSENSLLNTDISLHGFWGEGEGCVPLSKTIWPPFLGQVRFLSIWLKLWFPGKTSIFHTPATGKGYVLSLSRTFCCGACQRINHPISQFNLPETETETLIIWDYDQWWVKGKISQIVETFAGEGNKIYSYGEYKNNCLKT